jgi:hypothetical protein
MIALCGLHALLNLLDAVALCRLASLQQLQVQYGTALRSMQRSMQRRKVLEDATGQRLMNPCKERSWRMQFDRMASFLNYHDRRVSTQLQCKCSSCPEGPHGMPRLVRCFILCYPVTRDVANLHDNVFPEDGI